MINLFVGFDSIETVSYHTLVQSVIDRTTVPVSITPIKQSMLPIYKRERDPKQSNEFSFTRFMIPYLMGYDGWAIFMDCDMLLRTDLNELWQLRDPTKSVQVVKHDYTPKNQTKFLGVTQYVYPRKNWSSVMMFNCKLCNQLSPVAVNTGSFEYLHRLQWTDDELIGELPIEWNHLVGEYDYNPDAKLVHFTVGGPWFHEYMNCDYSDEWQEAFERTIYSDQISLEKSA